MLGGKITQPLHSSLVCLTTCYSVCLQIITVGFHRLHEINNLTHQKLFSEKKNKRYICFSISPPLNHVPLWRWIGKGKRLQTGSFITTRVNPVWIITKSILRACFLQKISQFKAFTPTLIFNFYEISWNKEKELHWNQLFLFGLHLCHDNDPVTRSGRLVEAGYLEHLVNFPPLYTKTAHPIKTLRVRNLLATASGLLP